MEKAPVLHKTVNVPQHRPQSEKSSPFRRLPPVPDTSNRKSDNRNCIWITQDILNEFKAQVARSHTVTLKFNNVDEKARELEESRRKFPPLFADRVRMIHNRTSSSYEMKEHTPNRPVKVYVEDIAKTHGTGHHRPDARNRSRDANRKQSSIVSKTHQQSSKTKRRCVDHRSSDLSNSRSMDSGDDGGELPDDVIETVAKANTVNTEYPAHILPEIRAAPCTIHAKRDKPLKGGQDGSIFATNSFISVKSPRRLHAHNITNITLQQNNPSHTVDAEKPEKPTVRRKGNKLDLNVKIPHQYPLTQAPLPKNMSSKDYVMTWLIHGSAPQGSNHFPDIIPPPHNQAKAKTKPTPRTHRKSELSE